MKGGKHLYFETIDLGRSEEEFDCLFWEIYKYVILDKNY